jgi:LacI family transcriptional regulator
MAGCRKWDCALLVKSFDFQDTDIPEQIKRLLERTPLRGAVVPEPMCDMQEVLDVLFAARVPVVRITPHSTSNATMDISIDNFQAAYELTDYLIGLGHKRIAFIKGPPDHRDANVRFEGFCGAMAAAGLPVVKEWCVGDTFEFSSGLTFGDVLLSRDERPTAIFACNDEIAAGVLAVAHEKGIKVPDEISVAGFDDAPLARNVWPALTTCRQKMELTGYMAIDVLIDPPADADARKRPQHHELVIRKSTASPKG